MIYKKALLSQGNRAIKVVDFGTNRKRVFDLLLVINSKLGTPILPRFRDIAVRFSAEKSYPTPILPEF